MDLDLRFVCQECDTKLDSKIERADYGSIVISIFRCENCGKREGAELRSAVVSQRGCADPSFASTLSPELVELAHRLGQFDIRPKGKP